MPWSLLQEAHDLGLLERLSSDANVSSDNPFKAVMETCLRHDAQFAKYPSDKVWIFDNSPCPALIKQTVTLDLNVLKELEMRQARQKRFDLFKVTGSIMTASLPWL